MEKGNDVDVVRWSVYLPKHELQGVADVLVLEKDNTLDLEGGDYDPVLGSPDPTLMTGFQVYRRDGSYSSHSLHSYETTTDYGYKVNVVVVRNRNLDEA